MSVKNWSTTPASNASVDSISWAEGQLPSTVNDSSREEMAQLKEWYNLITTGTVSGTVGGTADAITLTTTPSPFQAAYAVNQRFLFKASGPNTVSNPTFNTGSLGAKTIKLPGGSALAIPQWATNDMLLCAYDGTDIILLGGNSVVGVGTTLSLARNAQTGTSYTLLTGDRAKHVTYSNAAAIAVTLPQANGTTFASGWYHLAENISSAVAGIVTITPTTSTINGAATLVLLPGQWAFVTSDGTNYRAVIGGAGKQTIWLPAGSAISATTNGAADGTTESTTNKVMNSTKDFDATTSESIQWNIAMPKSWNLGPITFIPYWTAASGSGTFISALSAVALSDDDAIDTAFGTAQTSTDTLITALDVHAGPESAAITIAGTPAIGDIVYFKLARDISDTLGVDAKLIGVKLIYTTNVQSDL